MKAGRIMLNPSIMIRHARPDDSETLTHLAQRSKAHWGYDDAFMHAHREGLHVDTAYVNTHPIYVLEHGGAIVGFYALEHIDDAEVDLDFLFIEPAHIGSGFGRMLLEHARRRASELGYRHIRIVSDPNAAGFYRQMGATLWGVWRSPIIPGRELPVLQLACRIST